MTMALLDFDAARDSLIRGNIIIFPTETFFGVGGRALYSPAVTAVYRAKRREHTLPLPVVIGNMAQLPLVVRDVSPALLEIARQFWPGPLSVVCPAGPQVPALLTGGTGKLAVRVSSHPAVRDLCIACGPLCASSANISGRPAASRIEDLEPDLVQRVDGVFNALPEPAGGLPSTLVELKDEKTLVILREGAVDPDCLQEKGWTTTFLCGNS